MNSITQALEEAINQIENTTAILTLIISALIIIPYVLFGIGMYNAAKGCGLRDSWMAWVPIARKHLLAEVADFRRFQMRKQRKLTTQFEVISCLLLACAYAVTKVDNPLFYLIPITLITLLAYNQMFSYYYFYRLCDMENATIYFILGLICPPLNSIFVYQCR